MGYNLITNIETCYSDIPKLLYYSHIPSAIVVLLLGIFILFKSKENRLAGKIFFLISITFFIWVLVEGTIWFLYNSMGMMFLWSLLGILYALMHILSLCFVYAFIDKKDISLKKKYILALLLLPIILLAPTKYSLTGFDITNCQAMENSFFIGCRYLIGIVSIVWIIAFLHSRYKKAERESKKQILLLGFGILSFLLLFSWSEITGSLTQNFTITQYGLFGMPVFMAFLVYLIVQYKVFNIKLLAAQALVVATVILIGSQFFFIQNNTNRYLTGITLALVAVFGWWLAASVKREVQQKEELQVLAKKLDKANRDLEELDEAKDNFLSMAAHELNTPIAAIEGYLSMIIDEKMGGAIPEKAMGYLKNIFFSAQRLAGLVKNLLNVSRIESNRIHLLYAEAQLEDVIDQAITEIKIKADEIGHKLTFEKPAKKLPKTWIDIERIVEVIINIVGNAIKYTDPPGKITVTTHTDGDKIVIAIEDNGRGISKERDGHIFEKFAQGDILKDQVKGTGLGMFITKNLIELHSGKIWFKSSTDEKDHGTTFYVSLPILKEKPFDPHEGEGALFQTGQKKPAQADKQVSDQANKQESESEGETKTGELADTPPKQLDHASAAALANAKESSSTPAEAKSIDKPEDKPDDKNVATTSDKKPTDSKPTTKKT